MNTDMMGGVIRALGPAVVAFLVGKGIVPAGDYSAVFAAVTALGAALWSIGTNKSGKTIGGK